MAAGTPTGKRARYIGAGFVFGTILNDRVYLDHAATTPLHPAAAAAMAQGQALWANPSSPHAEGRAARRALEDARVRIAAALGWHGHVVLTAGASEALALALRGRRVAAGATEHDAVWRSSPEARVLAVDRQSLINPAAITVEPDERMVVQSVNSETGVRQPLAAIAPLVRAAGGVLVVDASQSAGKLPLPDADLIVVSGHKLGGPVGIGALLVRDLALLEPSGGQEFGYRAGTENLPAALGLAAALEQPRAWLEAAARWRCIVEAAVLDNSGEVIPPDAPRADHILSLRMPGVPAAAQLIRFDLAGIAVSAGSACASGSLKPSRVLAAMGIEPAAAAETIRVSTGWSTTDAEVERFVATWREIARDVARQAA